MRIAIITATPASVREGSGTHVAAEQLAAGLGLLGHEARLIRPEPSPLPTFTLRRFLFNRSLVEPTDVDVIVGFDMDGYRLAGNTRVPFVTYVHGCIADEMRFERGLTGFALDLQAKAERHSVRRAKLVLATSVYSKGRISALYGVDPARIAIAPPPADVAGWQREVAASGARPRGHLVILSAAHWYPRKNLPTLISAFLRVHAILPTSELRVVGVGPELNAGRSLARSLGLKDRVTFLGHISRKQLAAEYAVADVFCLPSRQEGFGLVYIEAMAASKPVVALESAGSPGELIAHGENGMLTRDDPDAVAEALLLLLSDTRLRARIGATNRVRAQRWEAPKSIATFLQALSAVV